MSKTNENHIKRQWQIIQFLIGTDNYTSSDDVLKNLQENGFDVKERTVQRDLNALAEIFPIECRKDDKPYSWRWQRVENSKKNLMNYEQAMIFMLVDSELREFLPDDLLERLYPLFVKAKMVMAGIDYQQRVAQSDMSIFKDRGHGGFYGAMPPSNRHILEQALQKLAELNPFKTNPQNLEPWQYMVKQEDMDTLLAVLQEQGFENFAKSLKGLDKKLKKIS